MMYLSYYNLNKKPFQISTDPKFLWLGEKHKEALAVLRYGILDNKGFILLTGDVGTGKTTLVNALLKIIGTHVRVATVHDPALEKLDFFNYIAQAFDINQNFTSKGSFLVCFSKFLRYNYDTGNKVLLIIDEAQRIQQDLLEEIRLLSNIELENTKLVNIFFVGQSEFNNTLLLPENRAIRQRITLNYDLVPLTESETEQYILQRMRVAGTWEKIFNQDAVRKIFYFSNGYPRLINIICDRALLTGFVENKKMIDAPVISECAKELRIHEFSIASSPMRNNRDQDPLASGKYQNSYHNFDEIVINEERIEAEAPKLINLKTGIIILLICIYVYLISAGYFFK